MITAAIKRVLGDGATDYELLCVLSEGVRFKAYVPPDHRLMHNLISLDSRGPQAAVTALGLIKQGRVACMKLGKRGELITPDGKCPLHFTPGEATGSGGADKKGDPSKARMVQKASRGGRPRNVVRRYFTGKRSSCFCHVATERKDFPKKQ